MDQIWSINSIILFYNIVFINRAQFDEWIHSVECESEVINYLIMLNLSVQMVTGGSNMAVLLAISLLFN